MIQTKQTYEAPEAETLVVRFEGVICESNTNNAPAFTGYVDEGWDA